MLYQRVPKKSDPPTSLLIANVSLDENSCPLLRVEKLTQKEKMTMTQQNIALDLAFQLSGEGVQITYLTSGQDGKPHIVTVPTRPVGLPLVCCSASELLL